MQHTPKGTNTRERILQSARQRLIERGLEAFVMRELAESLQIKLGNLQYYFKTRDALLLQLFESEADRDLQLIRGAAELSPAEGLRLIIRELVGRWRGRSGVLFTTLNSLALHNKAFRQLHSTIYKNFYAALHTPLKALNPALSETELALRSRMLTALIDGSSMQVQVGSLQTYLRRVEDEAERIALG